MAREDRSRVRSAGKGAVEAETLAGDGYRCLSRVSRSLISCQEGRLTFIALRAYTKAAELFAFALAAKVECVGELAGIAFLAQPTLVVLADQMTNTRSFVSRRVVLIRACWS